MAEIFDPSPRASKRQRTTYKGHRAILGEPSETVLPDASDSEASEVEKADASDLNCMNKEDNENSKPKHLREKTPARRSRRNTGQTDDTKENNAQSNHVQEDGESDTARDRDSTSSKENEEPTSKRSSGRAIRRPRRYSETLVSQHTDPVRTPTKETRSRKLPKTGPSPKSILTPSRRQRSGPPKTVVFDENEKAIETQLGFKDIRTTPKKHRQKNHATKSDNLDPSDNAPESTGRAVVVPADDLEFEDIINEELETSLDIPLAEPPLAFHPMTLNEDEPEVVQVKCQVLSRLTSRALTPPCHLESQYMTVRNLLTSTITAGESNSLLILGPRGSGKSILIDTALSRLEHEYPNDFHTIRLNGFFQTDDRLALKEIWRQLGREMRVDDNEVDEVSSYADTMASLLSLLAHPDELDPEAAVAEAGTGTKRSSKSIIFVLDEFDLFTTHPRQTLLYNLFDIAQSRKAPIAVLGCSTRMDVVDCLEKRVKSRYSHRWIHVPLARSIAVFEEAVKAVLLIDDEHGSSVDRSEKQEECIHRWNSFIKTTFLSNAETQNLIKQHFYTTKSLPNLLIALYPLVATLPSAALSDPSLTKPSSAPNQITSPPTLTSLLQSLPSLHLSLLAAATRLEAIHSLPTINFNLVHAHYTELVERGRQQQAAQTTLAITSNILSPAAGVGSTARAIGNAGGILRLWSRQTCRAAWEDLGRHEVVVPAAGGIGGVDEGASGSEEADSRMFRCNVMLEEVLWAAKKKWKEGEGAESVLRRWCSEI